jgi:hypothetical protein
MLSEFNESCFSLAALSLEPITPLPVPNHIDVFDDPMCKTLLNAVNSNFMQFNQTLNKDLWLKIFKTFRHVVRECTGFTRLAKISLFITTSRVSSAEMVSRLIPIIENSSMEESFYPLPEMVGRLLSCQTVVDAFSSFSHSPEYQYPPNIIIARSVNEFLRGWVCLNNCIVINYSVFHNIDPDCGILDMFTLILRESKHGDQRYHEEDYNNRTSQVMDDPSAQAGQMMEKLIWGGILPKWFRPVEFHYAIHVAKLIITNFEASGNLVFDQEMIILIKSFVGERESGGIAGVDIAEVEELEVMF